MQQTKYFIQVIRTALEQRVCQVSENSLRGQANRLENLSCLCKRENQRNYVISHASASLYENFKKQSAETLTDSIRLLYGASLAVFRLMCPSFDMERSLPRGDYRNLVELFRLFFTHLNNIKMMGRIDQLARNKTLKKPIVLSMVLKYLLETTKEFHQQHIKLYSQSITPDEIERYSAQKTKTANQTSQGFFTPDKIAVNNFDNVELDPVRSMKRNTVDVRRMRGSRLLMARNKEAGMVAGESLSFHKSAIINNSVINSVVNNYFIIKSPLIRPVSELNNYQKPPPNKDSSPKRVQSQDKKQRQRLKQSTQSLLRSRILRATRKRQNFSFAKVQPTKSMDRTEVLLKMYGVLDIEQGQLTKLTNQEGVRNAETNAWNRNKFIIRCRHEEESRFKARSHNYA